MLCLDKYKWNEMKKCREYIGEAKIKKTEI